MTYHGIIKSTINQGIKSSIIQPDFHSLTIQQDNRSTIILPDFHSETINHDYISTIILHDRNQSTNIPMLANPFFHPPQ
jgi:hypothetical protein